jgi:predicted amidophosphoribosyltransferase
LVQALARETGHPDCLDLLHRSKRTQSLNGLDRAARHAMLSDAIRINPARGPLITDRQVLVVDDVMTSGATLSACAQAAYAAGAQDVCILTLARVAKDA